MESRSVLLADAAATAALGRELALQWLQQCSGSAEPPILLLQGDLGAGKTCLVQGIASGLGIDEAITSPTFARGTAGWPQHRPGAPRSLPARAGQRGG